MNGSAARSLLLSHRMVAVLRTNSIAEALAAGHAALRGGARLIEVTLTVPEAFRVLGELKSAAPKDALIGVGTVLTLEELDRAVAAGADFAISPDVHPELIAAARARGLFHVPGAMTPSEVTAARRAGADVVKLFPSGSLGGPPHLRALRGPLPDVPLLATGGPGLADLEEYFASGVAAVGLAQTLIEPEWLKSGAYDRVESRTREYVERIARIPLRAWPAPA